MSEIVLWVEGRCLQDEGDVPAEFGLLQMPTGMKLRTARIYNVAEAQMYWQVR